MLRDPAIGGFSLRIQSQRTMKPSVEDVTARKGLAASLRLMPDFLAKPFVQSINRRELYVPQMAPPKPAVFVGREREVESILKILQGSSSYTHRSCDLVLVGAKGVGKSALAIALARHVETQAQFTDGVLWATLGPEPDILGILRSWGRELGVDLSKHDTPEARAQALRSLVENRRALIIIDDVRHEKDLLHLFIGGRDCRTIALSRDRCVAEQIGYSEPFVVERLNPPSSLTLLRYFVPDGILDEDVSQLAIELDGNPRALVVAGRLLATHLATSAQLLIELERRDRSRHTHSENEVGQTTILSLLELAYDHLPPEVKNHFHHLEAFGEAPETFSLEAASEVCELDVHAARETLATLVRCGLIESVRPGEFARRETQPADKQPDVDHAQSCHMEFYLKVAQNVWQNPESLEIEMAQIRRAYRYATKTLDREAMLQFLRAVGPYLSRTGRWQERLRWTKSALEVVRIHADYDAARKLTNQLGRILARQGLWDEAIKFYEQGRTLTTECADLTEMAHSLLGLGHALDQKNDRLMAMQIYEFGREMCDQAGDHAGRALLQNAIGCLFAKQETWEDALHQFEASREIQEELGDRENLATTLDFIGLAHLQQRHWSEALDSFERSRILHQALGDHRGEARALDAMGLAYHAKGAQDSALRCFEASLGLRVKFDDRAGMAQSLLQLGHVYARRRLWTEAIWHYAYSVALREEAGDRAGVGVALTHLGSAFQKRASWSRALQAHLAALEIFQQIHDRTGAADSLNRIGLILLQKGKRKQARSYFRRSERSFAELGDCDSAASVLCNMASTYAAAGHWFKALGYFERSLVIHESSDNLVGAAKALQGIGAALQAMGERREALRCFKRSAAIFARLGDKTNLAQAHIRVARIYEETGEWDKTSAHYEKSIVLLEAADQFHALAAALNSLGNLHVKRGNVLRAEGFYRKSLTLCERLGELNGREVVAQNLKAMAQNGLR